MKLNKLAISLFFIGILFTSIFKAQSNKIIGSYWTGAEEIFTSMDITNGTFNDIDTLTGVQTLNVGQTTFDPNNGNYINLTNLG
ncbi:MAG: hypothetical protein QNK84_04085, partial [Flavobacteriales bacterium]